MASRPAPKPDQEPGRGERLRVDLARPAWADQQGAHDQEPTALQSIAAKHEHQRPTESS